MSKTIIEVNNVSKKYVVNKKAYYDTLRDKISSVFTLNKKTGEKQKIFWALKDVSFKVKEGEVLGIVGRNGAGKSTLLKILSRITPPTSGNAILNGRVGSLLEVGTGFHQELTGRENIFLNGGILGMKQAEIRKKFYEIVDFSGVEKFLDTPVKYYSSGMATRLAFSVAAFLEPEILLVDEVLSVGDAEFQKKSLGKMEDITKNQGRTIIFVSHNLDAIRELTTNSILLDKGKLIKYGDTASVLDYYSQTIIPKTASQKLSLRKDRGGNGQIRLTDFHIIGDNGLVTDKLICGKKYDFVFEYKTKDNRVVKNVDIGFNVSKKNGESLFVVYSSYLNQIFKTLLGKGRLRFSIPRLPLAAGEYTVGARLVVNSDESDNPGIIGEFSVNNGDFYDKGVLVEQKHSPFFVTGQWELMNRL